MKSASCRPVTFIHVYMFQRSTLDMGSMNLIHLNRIRNSNSSNNQQVTTAEYPAVQRNTVL
jgi:hypothetical protein